MPPAADSRLQFHLPSTRRHPPSPASLLLRSPPGAQDSCCSDPSLPQISRAPSFRRFLSKGWDTSKLNQRVVVPGNSEFRAIQALKIHNLGTRLEFSRFLHSKCCIDLAIPLCGYTIAANHE